MIRSEANEHGEKCFAITNSLYEELKGHELDCRSQAMILAGVAAMVANLTTDPKRFMMEFTVMTHRIHKTLGESWERIPRGK